MRIAAVALAAGFLSACDRASRDVGLADVEQRANVVLDRLREVQWKCVSLCMRARG
jgi:hypothetical protein